MMMMDKTVAQIVAKLYGEDTPRKFRVWHIPQIPGESFKVEVPDFITARLLMETLAQYDLFQLRHNIKPDFANVSGIEYWDDTDGEWYGIYEDDYDRWEGK